MANTTAATAANTTAATAEHPQRYILVVNFGTQYLSLIIRASMEMGIEYKVILPSELCQYQNPSDRASIAGIILSGGPYSVLEKDAPVIPPQVLEWGLPIFGICYGFQLIAKMLGGVVGTGTEYGAAYMTVTAQQGIPLMDGVKRQDDYKVWMNHTDCVAQLPKTFQSYASTNVSCSLAGDHQKHIYGVQYHVESVHTPKDIGRRILNNFFSKICGLCVYEAYKFLPAQFANVAVEQIRQQVGQGKIICAVSGGIDSTVVAMLLYKALKPEQICLVFVDNGLMRKNEPAQVKDMFKSIGIEINMIDAAEQFLGDLRGVSDSEQKRKLIGHRFIRVFEAFVSKDVCFMAQGTLYPDVIESAGHRQKQEHLIKTHHNMSLPDDMRLKLVEPLRDLFKDQVRQVAVYLGLPQGVVNRQPFPGPGLAVRILGEVTKEKLDVLREVDACCLYMLEKQGLMSKIWQAFAVLLPVYSVGNQGDTRAYKRVCVLRVVDASDGMSASLPDISMNQLEDISAHVVNNVSQVGRMVLDITSKPPGTIEWE